MRHIFFVMEHQRVYWKWLHPPMIIYSPKRVANLWERSSLFSWKFWRPYRFENTAENNSCYRAFVRVIKCRSKNIQQGASMSLWKTYRARKITHGHKPVATSFRCIVIQSEPLAERPYANVLPSSVNRDPDSATVPSSDSVFGSRNTRGSPSRLSCTYRTLGEHTPYFH